MNVLDWGDCCRFEVFPKHSEAAESIALIFSSTDGDMFNELFSSWWVFAVLYLKNIKNETVIFLIVD